MSVCGRLNFFAAAPSMAGIGGGRNSARGVEWALYHQDEIQNAGRVLPDQMGWARLAGLMGTCQPHKGRVRTVCRR
jgi:hypothetical protein